MISSLELAKECGVSQGTVDRAIHNRKGISAATRKQIIAAAKKFGYHANPSARELITGKSSWVGAVLPARGSPFFSDFFDTIMKELKKDGLRLFMCRTENNEETIDILNEFAARRARAAILVPPDESLEIPDSISSSIQVLSVASPCRGKDIINIYPREFENGYKGTEYLISKNHRRIMFLSFARKSSSIRDRMEGYKACMAKHGLKASIMVPLDENKLLKKCSGTKPPTALFCHNDWLALTSMRILDKAGIKIPERISVLGIDNSPSFNVLCPGITTMEYPFQSVAEKIRNLISGRKEIMPFETFNIVERDTVASNK